MEQYTNAALAFLTLFGTLLAAASRVRESLCVSCTECDFSNLANFFWRSSQDDNVSPIAKLTGSTSELATSDGSTSELATSDGSTSELATFDGSNSELATSDGSASELATSETSIAQHEHTALSIMTR